MSFWKPLWAWLWGVRGQQESWREKPTTTAGADTTEHASWIPVTNGIYSLERQVMPNDRPRSEGRPAVTGDHRAEKTSDEIGSQEPMVGERHHANSPISPTARNRVWYVTDEWPLVPEEELRKRKANKCE